MEFRSEKERLLNQGITLKQELVNYFLSEEATNRLALLETCFRKITA